MPLVKVLSYNHSYGAHKCRFLEPDPNLPNCLETWIDLTISGDLKLTAAEEADLSLLNGRTFRYTQSHSYLSIANGVSPI